MGFSSESVKLLRSLPEELQASIVGKLTQAERVALIQAIKDFDSPNEKAAAPSLKEQATQALEARKAAEAQKMEVPGAGNFPPSRTGWGRELLTPLSYLSPITAGVRYLSNKLAPKFSPEITPASVVKGALDVNRAPLTIAQGLSPRFADVMMTAGSPGMPPIYGSGGAAVAEGQRMSDALSEKYYTPQAGQVVGSMVSPLSLIPGGTGANIATKVLTGAGAGALGAALGTPIRDVDQKTPWEVAKEVGSNAATGATFGGGLSLAGSAVGKLLGRAPGPGWVEVRPGEWVDKPVADKLKPYLDAGLTLPDAAAAKEFKRGLPAAPTTAQRLEAQGIARGTVPAETVWGNATEAIPHGPTNVVRDWVAAPGPSNQARGLAREKMGQLAEKRMGALTPTERAPGPVVEGAAPVRTRIAPAPVGTPQGAGYRADVAIRRVVENERAPASKLYAEFLSDHGDSGIPTAEFKGIMDEARLLGEVTEAEAQAISRLDRRGADLAARKVVATSPRSSVGEGLTLVKDRLAQMESRAQALLDDGKEIPQSMQDSLTNLRTMVRKSKASKAELNDRVDRLIDAYGEHADDVRATAIQPTVEGMVEFRKNLNQSIKAAQNPTNPNPTKERALLALRNRVEESIQRITGDDYAKFKEANSILTNKVYPLSRESGLLVKGQADAGPLATEKAFKAVTDPTSMEHQAFQRLDPEAKQVVVDAAITRVTTDVANSPSIDRTLGKEAVRRNELMKIGASMESFKEQVKNMPEVAAKVDDFITVTNLLSDLPQSALHRAAEARSARSLTAHMLYSMLGTLGHTAAGQKFLLGMRGTPRALSTAERKLVEEAYQRASFQVAKESAKERK